MIPHQLVKDKTSEVLPTRLSFNIFSKLSNSFLAVIIMIQVLLITLSILFGRMTIEVLEQNEADKLTTVINNINSAINFGVDGPKIAISTIAKNEKLMATFAKHDRELLLQETRPIFDHLKSLGFKQFQFHIPQGTTYVTLLRVHNPSYFGEDLVYRPMIFKANATNEMIAGIEQGKSGYGFRVVVPVEYNRQHVGSFEIGYDIGEPFLTQLNKDFPGNWALYNLNRGVQSVDDRILLTTLGHDRDGEFQNLPLTDNVLKKITVGETFSERDRQSNTGTLYVPVRNYRGDISLVIKYVFQTDYFNRINRVAITAVIICLIGLALSGLVIYVLNQLISGPVQKLVAETEKIQKFELDEEITFRSSLKEMNELITATRSMKTGLQAFRKYVPAQLVQQLIESKQEAKIGGQRREITVFFSDVADFTTISESLTPNELTQQLSEYLSIMTDTIIKHSGTVDKYIGDCVMAFWGAPLDLKNHAELACKAALECEYKCRELNARWLSEGKKPFATRIGINSGEIVVGNIGSSQRLSYTIIGDEVNLASRLEGLNKTYGTRCIVSESTVLQLPPDFALRLLDFVVVKGKTKPVTIYELVAEKGDIRSIDLEFLSNFNEVMNLYKTRQWDKAIEALIDLLALKPGDKASLMIKERCELFKNDPPPEKWRGEIAYH